MYTLRLTRRWNGEHGIPYMHLSFFSDKHEAPQAEASSCTMRPLSILEALGELCSEADWIADSMDVEIVLESPEIHWWAWCVEDQEMLSVADEGDSLEIALRAAMSNRLFLASTQPETKEERLAIWRETLAKQGVSDL